MSYKDLNKKKEYRAKYYSQNKDRILESARKKPVVDFDFAQCKENPYFIKNGEVFNENIIMSFSNIKDFFEQDQSRIDKFLYDSANDSKTDERKQYNHDSMLSIQQSYIDLLENNEDLNIGGVKFKFSDSYWNFNSLKKEGKHSASYVLYFTKNAFDNTPLRSEEFNIILRLFALYNIYNNGLHSGGNSSKFHTVHQFLFWLETKEIYSLLDMDVDIVKKFKEEHETNNIRTTIGTLTNVRSMLVFYCQLTNTSLDRELDIYLTERDQKAINAHMESAKVPLLPTKFYIDYTDLLYQETLNKKNSKKERGLCGLLYLNSQGGERPGEIVMLNCDSMKSICEANIVAYYLDYRSTKNGTGRNNVYTYNRTAMNEKSVIIYKYLVTLFAKERKALKTKKLVPHPTQINNEYSTAQLTSFNILFCVKHAKKLGLINRTDSNLFLSSIKIDKYNNDKNKRRYTNLLKKYEIDITCIVSIPAPKQFRVYVATDLHNRGVSDKLISKMFGHTTTKMLGYYIRQTHPIQEDIDFSKEIVSEIVSNDLNILGAKGNDFKNKINEIISSNGLNVQKDLDAIVDKVCGEMPIRAKLGGFCVKSNPKRECRHDANSDELLCAYGCCPNHCHLYFMATVTYEKCKEHFKIVNHNIANDFVNSAQKAAKIFMFAILNELEPELQDLKNEIKKQGINSIVEKHPDMNNIILNIDSIYMEIEKWKKLIEKTKNL